MNDKEQRALATEVAKTSNNVSVKFGRTNGQHCLHLRHNVLRKSETIYSQAEWHLHPWHRENFASPVTTPSAG